ncbi:DNA/RNA non-specific endonuclease [Qipengyuania sp.]|uniref:DNA/RNA non-specific endonuclease n=1 Tax=Qipengyuania sp. TaxID=2004515 RepID=UPI003AF8D696
MVTSPAMLARREVMERSRAARAARARADPEHGADDEEVPRYLRSQLPPDRRGGAMQQAERVHGGLRDNRITGVNPDLANVITMPEMTIHGRAPPASGGGVVTLPETTIYGSPPPDSSQGGVITLPETTIYGSPPDDEQGDQGNVITLDPITMTGRAPAEDAAGDDNVITLDPIVITGDPGATSGGSGVVTLDPIVITGAPDAASEEGEDGETADPESDEDTTEEEREDEGGAAPGAGSEAVPGGAEAPVAGGGGALATLRQLEPESPATDSEGTPIARRPRLVPYRLDQRSPRFGEVKAPLRMPAYLAAKPKQDDSTLPSQLADYAGYFTKAAATARQVYDEIRQTASRERSRAQATAHRLADRRTLLLDISMRRLSSDFEGAVAELRSAELSAAAELRGLARNARRAIHAAARNARGTINARRTSLEGSLAEQQTRRQDCIALIDNDVACINWGASHAPPKMAELRGEPSPAFVTEAETGSKPNLALFTNEILGRFIPEVARLRHTFWSEEAGKHTTRAQQTRTNVVNTLDEGFREFDQLLATLAPASETNRGGGPAMQQIGKMERKAIDGCDDAERKIRAAILKVRVEGENSLAEQFENSRAAIADNIQQIADREITAEEKGTNALVMRYDGLAFAQGIAITSLAETIAGKTDLAPEEFAGFVIQSATNAQREAQGQTRKQLDTMVRSSRKTEDSMVKQADGSRAAIDKSAHASGAVMGKAARKIAATLAEQVAATRDTFRKMPDPVIKTLDNYPIPGGQDLQDRLDALALKVTDAFEVANAAWEGRSPQLQSPQPTGGNTPPATEEGESPQLAPKDFVDKSYVVGVTPQDDERVQEKRTEAKGASESDINERSEQMDGQMTLTGQSPEETMEIVRGISYYQGWALREGYEAIRHSSLWDDIPYYVSFGNLVTDPWVRFYYGRAIQNYLQGNRALGARYELQGATWGWDDTDQVDKAMSALDVTTREELQDLPDPDIMTSIREDLDGVDAQVYDMMMAGDAQGARALRLEQAVKEARDARGDDGADAAYDAMTRYYNEMGASRMETEDPYNLMGTTLYPGAPPTPEEMEATRAEQWNDLMLRYGNRGVARESSDEGLDAGVDALMADVTAVQTYTDWTPGEDRYGNFILIGRQVDEGISAEQAQLMREAARHGPRSARARAAQVIVEENREGGPKRDRVENALDFEGLNDGLANPDARPRPPREDGEEEEPVNARALRQREEMLRAYAELHGETSEGAATPSSEDIRRSMGDRLATAAGDDANLAALMRARAVDEPHSPRVAALAVRDAVERGGTLEEEIKRQFGRMSREQIEAAAAIYEDMYGEDMFARLGIFEHSDDWGTELSGDDANEIQVLAMGQPRNDRERFEVARMRSRIEIDDSTELGRWLASDEAARMQATYDRLNLLAGGDDLSFDQRGYITNRRGGERIGNFDAEGNFSPTAESGFDPNALSLTISSARHATTKYKAATDAIANIITTSLVVAAAAVSTFFTGGGAAAIWVPVLTTMAAGMAGMAVNYAIKGGRYGYEDMARDFAMTIIQSATAGAGAAAGVYLAGGKTALQAVGSRLMVADEALSSFLAAGGKSMRTLGMMDEIAIGGMTGIMGGVGNAVMDERAWDRGEWGSEFGHHLAKGAISGVIGAGAGRAFGSGSQNAAAQFTGRTVGSGAGAFMGSVAEAAYDADRGKRRGRWGDVLDQAWVAGLQATAQGVLEYGAERAGDHYASRHPDGRTARARRRMMDTEVRLPGGSRGGEGGSSPGRRPGTLGHDIVDPAQLAAIRSNKDLSDTLDAVLLADRFGIPISPEMLPEAIRPIARALADAPDSAPDLPRMPSAANDPGEPAAPRMRSRDDPDADTPASERITRELPAFNPDEPVTPRRAHDDRDHAGEQSLVEFLGDGAVTEQKVFANTDLDREMLRHQPSVPDDATIYASDPHSYDAAKANYDALRGADPHREALIAHNPVTGEYKVIQGVRGSVRAPGEGWATLRHSHPRLHETTVISDRLSASLPSSFGGDFTVLRGELLSGVGTVQTPEGTVRSSIIDIRLGDQHYETHFSITRNGHDEQYRVSFRPPHDGVGELGPFSSIGDFETVARSLAGGSLPQASTRDGHIYMGREGGESAVVSRRSATHGEMLGEAARGDIDFIRRRMEMADDFDLQVQGLRQRGDIDPVLGRSASISDAHDRVQRMGLVGQEDSMIRLHNILNDETIPIATRAMISDVTLEATRQHMLDTGQLAPGEPLVMLFHGATRSRSDDLIETGIDFTRNPGGVDDDFGEGLYFTRHFESARAYREGRHGDVPGDVIPYILRGSDLGVFVDVSTGGAHRRQWEDFVMNNLHLFAGAEGRVTPEVARRMIDGTLTFDDLPYTTRRGEAFNAFLASLGAEHGNPQIIFGDLGGPLTSGIQYRGGVTDQAAVRSQRLGDLLNAQHVRRSAASGDVTSGEGGTRLRSRDFLHDSEGAPPVVHHEEGASAAGEPSKTPQSDERLHAAEQATGEAAAAATAEAALGKRLLAEMLESTTPLTDALLADAAARRLAAGEVAEIADQDEGVPQNNPDADDTSEQATASRPEDGLDTEAADTVLDTIDAPDELSALPPQERVPFEDADPAERFRQAREAIDHLRQTHPDQAAFLDGLAHMPEAMRDAAVTAIFSQQRKDRGQAIRDFETYLKSTGVDDTTARQALRNIVEFTNYMSEQLRLSLRHVAERQLHRASFEQLPDGIRGIAQDSNLLHYVGAHHPDVLQELYGKFATAHPDLPDQTTAKFEEFVARALTDRPDIQAETVGRRIVRMDSLDDFDAAAAVATPLTRYEFGRMAFTTDAMGRVIMAEGVPVRTRGKRHGADLQRSIGHEGDAGDVGFHLLAHIFGGPVNRLNVVPGNGKRVAGDPGKNLNSSAYKVEFENRVREIIENLPDIVEVQVEPIYSDDSTRPDRIQVRFRTDAGDWVAVPVFLNQPGGGRP